MKYLLLLLIFTIFSDVYSQVTPLLTTTWNQGCNYNDSVPVVSGGPCGKAYTGCVPTAIAQLLKFHSYPTTGWGQNTHNVACCGSFTVDFGAQTYNYAAMPNSLSSGNAQVAQLMFHCGIAAEAYYSPSNTISGGSISDMKRYFKYSLEMTGKYKNQCTNTEFENLLISELNAGRVIAAVGGSHQYLIDGYKTSPSLQFHVNFGWGGSYNGYYNVHNIVIAGTNYTPALVTYQIKPLIAGFEVTDSVGISSAASLGSFELSSFSPWSVLSSSSWISPQTMSGSSGYHSLLFNTTANPLYTERTGSIVFTNGTITRTLTVVQSGISPSLSVSPTSLSMASGGGTSSITVSTDSIWTASTSESWLLLTPNTGSGNGTFDITASANGVTNRTGYVTVQRGSLSQVIEIIQGSSSTFWCVPSITTGGTEGISQVTFHTINRTSAVNEGYIVSSDTSHIYLDSTYQVFVTFQGGVAPAIWIDWNNDGDFNDSGEPVVPPASSWYPSFSSTKTATITVPSGASLGLTRMRVYGKDFGTGPVSNPCATTDQGGDIEDYHLVIRDSRFITSTPASLTFPSGGSVMNTTIATDSLWEINSCPAWITPSVTSGGNGSLVSFTTTANTDFSARTGLINLVRGSKLATVSVIQSGADSLISLSTSSLNIPSNGATSISFTVTSNFDYTLTPSDSWIVPSASSGSNTQNFVLDVFSNSGATRTGTVIVGNGTKFDTLFVVQDSASMALTVSPDTLLFTAAGGTQTLTIQTPSDWFCNVADSWITLDAVSGTGDGNVLVTCASNPSGQRTSEVLVSTSGASGNIVIIQEAGDLSVSDLLSSSGYCYPNPFTAELHIKTDQPIQWVLTDQMGRFILSGNSTSIYNLDELASGSYIITVQLENGNRMQWNVVK